MPPKTLRLQTIWRSSSRFVEFHVILEFPLFLFLIQIKSTSCFCLFFVFLLFLFLNVRGHAGSGGHLDHEEVSQLALSLFICEHKL